MLSSTKKTLLGSSVLLLAAACGGAQPAARVAAPTAAAAATPGACPVALGARPVGHTGAGGTLALATIGGARVLLVADEDAKAILTLDLATKRELARTDLGSAPAQVYVAKDGRIFVTLRQANELVVLGATRADAPLSRGCAVRTADEPIALAGTPDGKHVLVTSGWAHKLSTYDATTLARTAETDVGREPRAVVVSDDGKTAYVSHAVGSVVSRIELAQPRAEEIGLRAYRSGQAEVAKQIATPRPRSEFGTVEKDLLGEPTCQGFALAKVTGRILVPEVAVDPGQAEARPDGYGSPDSETESPSIAVIDEISGKAMFASLVAHERLPTMRRQPEGGAPPECLLPRAAAIDPGTGTLLVGCFGIDSVVAYDALAAAPLSAERRRWSVGAGPGGIVVDPDTHQAIVWSQFDRTVSSFPIGGRDVVADEKALPVTKVKLAALADAPSPAYQLGRLLFHSAGDSRIAHDGRACASCHPDGRDDAITWATPTGPRRTIMLAGRASATAPYSWNGGEDTLPGHLGTTFDRLHGEGIRSLELDALVTYFTTMPAPRSTPPADAARIERGRTIFASAETGCATCHSGPAYTDGKNHDVGSKREADRTAAFNTPSLHLVGGTGPYFHDGRYANLRELLVKSDGTMGHTKHLSNDDLGALESFLRTL